MKHIFFVTGPPGIGKTTVLVKAAETLEKKGYKLGGMLTREVRENGMRMGFEIIDYETKKRGWLAHVHQPSGPQIGKYRVNLMDLESIGASAIQNAVTRAEIIVIDEVGPMELHSAAFKEAVNKALESGKLIIGVIHERAHDSLKEIIKKNKNAEIIQVTYANREQLHNDLIEKVNQVLIEKTQKER